MSNTPGVTSRRTSNGIPVMRVHYSADPERDSEWAKKERRKYSSQADWDKEQEIVHEAGGGDPVFLHILNRYWDKIVITDPSFEPSPWWQRLGGFDHGKTNPTALLDSRVDQDGTIYFCGEYYQPGLSPAQHCDFLREQWPEVFTIPSILADPSIFYKTQAQPKGGFKAISDLYDEQGLKNLVSAPENMEIAGMERILAHWHDLDHREPSIKIVLLPTQSADRCKPGLSRRGCPNLLWELKRTRRAKSTAAQLMKANPTEQIVDKDNHARDAMKYIVFSLPEPSIKPADLQVREVYQQTLESGHDPTSAAINALRLQEQLKQDDEPAYFGQRGMRRLSQRKFL